MDEPGTRSGLQVSLRWRITLPFLLLALALGLGGTYLIVRLIQETEDERFLRQLANSGQQAADEVVRAETDLLEVERLVANTEGVLSATLAEDAEDLRALVLPLVVNADADVVAVVDDRPLSLLSVRRQLEGGPRDYETVRGEEIYAGWPVVDSALAGGEREEGGEKHVGLGTIETEGGPLPGLFVAGPLRNLRGEVVGAVLVGEYLPNLVERMAEASGANVSVYDLLDGRLLATSLEAGQEQNPGLSEDWLTNLAASEEETPVRPLEIASVPYREALTPLTARGGEAFLGVVGVSLIDTVEASEGQELPVQREENVRWAVGFGALGLLLIGLVGLAISNSITRPLVEIAQASADVAQGDLDVEVPERGGGEVETVARAFNSMVTGLRQATQSTEFSGGPSLPTASSDRFHAETRPLPEAMAAEVSLVVIGLGWQGGDEDGLPERIAEREDLVLNEIEDAMMAHRGQLLTYEGDRALGAFGMPGQHLPARVGALLALHAAFDLLEDLQAMDMARRAEGRPGLRVRAAVHSGRAVLTDIGRKYGLAPVLLGDSVDTARALLTPARQAESGILVSEATHDRLAVVRSQFSFGRRGVVSLGLPAGDLVVYEVLERKTALVPSER